MSLQSVILLTSAHSSCELRKPHFLSLFLTKHCSQVSSLFFETILLQGNVDSTLYSTLAQQYRKSFLYVLTAAHLSEVSQQIVIKYRVNRNGLTCINGEFTGCFLFFLKRKAAFEPFYDILTRTEFFRIEMNWCLACLVTVAFLDTRDIFTMYCTLCSKAIIKGWKGGTGPDVAMSWFGAVKDRHRGKPLVGDQDVYSDNRLTVAASCCYRTLPVTWINNLGSSDIFRGQQYCTTTAMRVSFQRVKSRCDKYMLLTAQH